MEANYPAEEKGLSWPQVYLSNTTLIIVLLSFIIYLDTILPINKNNVFRVLL